MTPSIFLPRRSRAWPAPSTHLTESTMLVLPEPFGPTIAVTPPSNRISVARANVLKPSSCNDRRIKGRFTVADGVSFRYHLLTLESGLLQRFAELTAGRRLDLAGLGFTRRQNHHGHRRRLGCIGCVGPNAHGGCRGGALGLLRCATTSS